jgi:lipopolysaccharide heptosyltransferase I
MKILIIKPSSLGDIIHGLIVAQAIKTQLPDAHITWVARDSFAPVLQSVEAVDRVISFNRRGGFFEFLRLLKEIRKEKYDAVLEMQGLLRSGIMAWAARAPVKIGRRDGREGAQMFVNKLVALPKDSRHAADILMEFLPALGMEKIYAPIKLKSPIAHPQLPANSILVFPSARGKDSRAPKEWPYFKELTEKLIAELSKSNTNIRIAWCSDIKLKVPDGILDFTGGKISLRELLPFIAQAKLVISNDSGPMHMAAAAQVPLIALFGPTDPKLVGPYPPGSPQNRVIKSATGRIGDIKVEEVLRCVRELLK